MSGKSYAVTMGDRGRLVVPWELRQRAGMEQGTPLLMVESDGGVVVLTRTRAREVLRRQLAGHDLVAELLEQRRSESAVETRAAG